MIDQKPLPLKHTGLWFAVLCCGLIMAYLFFVGLISVWTGFTQMHQDGFWMPVLVGGILLLFPAWIFYRVSRFLFNRMKEKEGLRAYSA